MCRKSHFFLSGSIKENLVLGLERVPSEDEIMQACKIAEIADFIEALPLKFNTVIEESASNLSGGQKQRLAIARALLRQTDVMIFDESTSAIDPFLEVKIMDNLIGLNNVTILFITHSILIAKKCDHILVFDEGTIVEQGSHIELMAQTGLYYKMVTSIR